jgi:sigma-B regulation protein RsbU (phosphoserine phosphatase)
MSVNGPPGILVCAREVNALAEYRRALAAAGHEVAGHLVGGPDPDRLAACRLVVVDGTGCRPAAVELCRRLRSRLDEAVLPLVFVTDDHDPGARLAGLEAGADACVPRPFAPGELLAQVRALLRIKETHDRLAERAAEVHRVNKRLQQAYQQIDQELELAQRIQSSFLPQSLPELPRVRFAARYRLCGRVGGDFYDVFRLDERHVGLYVADAMGHGVPASLLTVFVKKGIRAKEVFGKEYRLVPPGEVIGRLNQDLIDQRLSENPFITMVYALYDHEGGTLQFARAGHPYPLYVPREGPPELWRQQGLLLGVVDASFAAATHALRPGDKVLLYSDGVDGASYDGQPPGAPSLMACAERHRSLPVGAFVDRLARDLSGAGENADDLTLLGLEVTD